MEGCLLCLDLKEFVTRVGVNSEKWRELNIKNLLQKYLWPMTHVEATSGICAACWSELYSFHKFYVRIEEVHRDFGLLTKNMENLKKCELDIVEKTVNEMAESPKDVVEPNPLGEVEDSTVEELKYFVNESDNQLQNEIVFKEQKPLIKNELDEERLIGNIPLLQKRKRGRPRTCNGSHKAKTTLNKTKKYKKRNIKDISHGFKEADRKFQNKDIDNIQENNINDVNFETKQETVLLPFSEEAHVLFDNDSDSNNGGDRESLYHCPSKININEKDKFLLENFKITCFLCNITFETFFNMRKHFEVEHKELGHVKCCNKKFYRRSILVDHVHYHLNPNYFKCSECGKVMADRRCLELHAESHESNNEKNNCCDICGKGFTKLVYLKRHRKIHLSDEEKQFSCSDCGKHFASNYSLSSHYRSVHLKKNAKICDICGKSIRCKDVFERHMLQHEGKTAPSTSCDICGLLLTDKKALKRHKDIIHPEGGQHEYTCSICSKTSPNLRAHKRHVQYKHVMGYDHKCTICDKAFKRAPTLKEHMASHTGTILYTCPWCPKTFISNANMHNHRKKIHPKEWEEASRKRYSGNLPPKFKPPAATEPTDCTLSVDI